MMVFDVGSETMIEVSTEEAAAGLIRYARTLGPGSAACGVWEERAVRLLDKAPERTGKMQPKIRLPLEGIPDECGSCGVQLPRDLDLTVYCGRLNVTCPACFSVVAPVVAVRAESQDAPEPGRATAAELLGIAPDWTGGQDVDDYVRGQRR